MHKVFFSLGTNLGDREEMLRRAIELINEKIGTVMRQSSFFMTPFPGDSRATTVSSTPPSAAPQSCLHTMF